MNGRGWVPIGEAKTKLAYAETGMTNGARLLRSLHDQALPAAYVHFELAVGQTGTMDGRITAAREAYQRAMAQLRHAILALDHFSEQTNSYRNSLG